MDEGTVRRYKADLTDEIEPQINELLSRAERGLQVLLKRESMLQAKVDDTLVLKLVCHSHPIVQVETSQSRPSSRATAHNAGMSKIDVRRLQMLARQRQKLEEEAAQLQAEVDAMVPASFPLPPFLCPPLTFRPLQELERASKKK